MVSGRIEQRRRHVVFREEEGAHQRLAHPVEAGRFPVFLRSTRALPLQQPRTTPRHLGGPGRDALHPEHRHGRHHGCLHRRQHPSAGQTDGRPPSSRHNGRATVAMVDGHAEAMRGSQVGFTLARDTAGALWDK
ncbi:MAG: hypothetical protein EB141_21075 [Verrucomicrobia bacterium]|nr:hypothetical protein [Verrucomicrobiota bacterium]